MTEELERILDGLKKDVIIGVALRLGYELKERDEAFVVIEDTMVSGHGIPVCHYKGRNGGAIRVASCFFGDFEQRTAEIPLRAVEKLRVYGHTDYKFECPQPE